MKAGFYLDYKQCGGMSVPVLLRLSAQHRELLLSPMSEEDAGLDVSSVPLKGLAEVKLRSFYDAAADAFGFRVSFRADGARSGSFITRDTLTAKIVFLVL